MDWLSGPVIGRRVLAQPIPGSGGGMILLRVERIRGHLRWVPYGQPFIGPGRD